MQTVTGFGATVTDATVESFNMLSSSALQELLSDIFTTSGDGIGLSLMRHTIGASDLSPSVYTYNDNGAVEDPTLANFSLGTYGTAMLQMLKLMKSFNPDIKLIGAPWSAPGWMKLNKVVIGNTVNNNINMTYASSFAQYFVKYIQAFLQQGVAVDLLTLQNEPLYSTDGYPTMYVYADESATLIGTHIGPALVAAGLNTTIVAYDHNTDVPSYPQTALDSADAAPYIGAIGWHCYAQNNSWSVLTDFHTANPNVPQYMTECWTSPQASLTQVADFTMGPLRNWAAGVLAWTLGSTTTYGPHLSTGGCTTCRGLVVIDAATKTYTKTIDFYMMGQFSKFIPRGAVVLKTGGGYDFGGGTKLEAVATVNPDGTRTLVVQNNFGNPIFLTVTTSSGQTWSGPLDTKSVVTWILPASSCE